MKLKVRIEQVCDGETAAYEFKADGMNDGLKAAAADAISNWFDIQGADSADVKIVNLRDTAKTILDLRVVGNNDRETWTIVG